MKSTLERTHNSTNIRFAKFKYDFYTRNNNETKLSNNSKYDISSF